MRRGAPIGLLVLASAFVAESVVTDRADRGRHVGASGRAILRLAYLQVRLYYNPDDGTDYAYAHDSARDIRGCEARSKSVVLRTRPVKDPYQLEIILREKDADTGDIAFNDDAIKEYDLTP